MYDLTQIARVRFVLAVDEHQWVLVLVAQLFQRHAFGHLAACIERWAIEDEDVIQQRVGKVAGASDNPNAIRRAQFGALTPDEQVQLVLLLNKALWSDEPVAPA